MIVPGGLREPRRCQQLDDPQLGEWKYQAEREALGDIGVPQRDWKTGGKEAPGVVGRPVTQEAVGLPVLRFQRFDPRGAC